MAFGTKSRMTSKRMRSFTGCIQTAVVALALVACVQSLVTPLVSRRDLLRVAVATTGVITGWKSCEKASISVMNPTQDETVSSSRLLSIIPTVKFGAPATNATISKESSLEIESMVSRMEGEAKNTNNNAVSSKLSGSWRLLYSNAPEIVSLSKGLPLGFQLGPTYQPLDTSKGIFENRAQVCHPYHLAALQTIVLGRVSPGTIGSLNNVGIDNRNNNRVNIEFERIIFQLNELFGRTLDEPIRKTLIPTTKASTDRTSPDNNGQQEVADDDPLPANDQTYLDDAVRVVRGGDGSLFVFSRNIDHDDELSLLSPRMMTTQERDQLLDSFQMDQPNNNQAFSLFETTPLGNQLDNRSHRQGNSVPVEIEYLLPDRTKRNR